MKREREEFYRCSHCDLQCAVLTPGSDAAPPVHCGAPMLRQQANTVDASREKHVPVIRPGQHGVIVSVGSAPHPMTEEHFIEWIRLSDGILNCRQHLSPGDPPEAEFPLRFRENMTAECSCNLHGIWKNSSQKNTKKENEK